MHRVTRFLSIVLIAFLAYQNNAWSACSCELTYYDYNECRDECNTTTCYKCNCGSGIEYRCNYPEPEPSCLSYPCPPGYTTAGGTTYDSCNYDASDVCYMACATLCSGNDTSACPANATCTYNVTYTTSGRQYYNRPCIAQISRCPVSSVTCNSGYTLTSDNKCQTICAPGQRLNSNGTDCIACTNTTGVATWDSTGECKISKCEDYYKLLDNVCRQCDAFIVPGVEKYGPNCEIESCETGYVLSGDKCVCAKGYYQKRIANGISRGCVKCGEANGVYANEDLTIPVQLITDGTGSVGEESCKLPIGTYYDMRGEIDNNGDSCPTKD